MRQTLFTFLLLLFTMPCLGQAAPFEKYHFEDGGYTFLGIFSHHDNHPLQKKMGEFYTDDLPVLNAIKKAWKFKKPQYQHACGYHYQIILQKNGESIDSWPINLECNEMVTEQGSVYFDLKKLQMFAPKFKHLRAERREFVTASEARRFLAEAKRAEAFIYAWPPRWLIYEGEFQFGMKCPADLGKDCYMTAMADKLESRLREELSSKYPGESFELKASGGSSNGDVFVRIKCTKSLEEKFDIYDRWGKTAFGKWEPYHLTLTFYRKA